MCFTVINGHAVNLVPSDFRRRFYTEVAGIVDHIHTMNLIESLGGNVPFKKRQEAEIALKWMLSVGSYTDDNLQASLRRKLYDTTLFNVLPNAALRLVGDVEP